VNFGFGFALGPADPDGDGAGDGLAASTEGGATGAGDAVTKTGGAELLQPVSAVTSTNPAKRARRERTDRC
jgi:hypothetical protein